MRRMCPGKGVRSLYSSIKVPDTFSSSFSSIGDRPDRVEPRAVKRRPKAHKLLTKPRQQARAELLAGAER
jgi:hypothetical protein